MIRNESGSMTVELTLLMGVILFVLISFLYLSLFLRDVWVLNQSCRMQASIYARVLSVKGESINIEEMQEEWVEIFNQRMLIIRVNQCQIKELDNSIEVGCQGEILIPFQSVARLFRNEDGWTISCNQSRIILK